MLGILKTNAIKNLDFVFEYNISIFSNCDYNQGLVWQIIATLTSVTWLWYTTKFSISITEGNLSHDPEVLKIHLSQARIFL